MAARSWQTNFSKGWISPEAEARFDLSAYKVGLRQAINVNIRKTGGVAKRMGSRFVAKCLSGTGKLLAFQFSDEQAYALEFGQAYMRPLALGGAVMEEGLAVISITRGATTIVEVNYHGWEVGDQVYLTGIEGMTEINDRFLTVLSVGDQHHVTLDIDSTGFAAFTGSGGGTIRTGPVVPPSPPVVPPPLDPPTPPRTGTGGSGGYDGLGSWRTLIAR